MANRHGGMAVERKESRTSVELKISSIEAFDSQSIEAFDNQSINRFNRTIDPLIGKSPPFHRIPSPASGSLYLQAVIEVSHPENVVEFVENVNVIRGAGQVEALDDFWRTGKGEKRRERTDKQASKQANKQ